VAAFTIDFVELLSMLCTGVASYDAELTSRLTTRRQRLLLSDCRSLCRHIDPI